MIKKFWTAVAALSLILGSMAAIGNPAVAATAELIEVTTLSYEGFLGRPPDAAGLKFWSSGQFTAAEIAENIVASPEFISQGQRPVEALYLNLLNRKADSAGLDYWESKPLHITLQHIGYVGKINLPPIQIATESQEWATVSIAATSNGSHQPDLIVREAVWNHFGDLGIDTYTTALRIARCESGYDPEAHRSTRAKRLLSGDRGLFQINSVHDERLLNLGIISTKSDLFNPDNNAAAARLLFDGRGSFADWFKSDHCW